MTNQSERIGRQTEETLPRSVVMTNWAMGGREDFAEDPQTAAYELMLLSLLYDEILIQDEFLALNSNIASWFGRDPGWSMLEDCLNIGSIVMLTNPESLYRDSDLRAKAPEAPIKTRALDISRHGTKNELPFTPGDEQLAFYDHIDAYLKEHRQAQRPVAYSPGWDIMQCFGRLLAEILASEAHGKWIEKAFTGITKSMMQDFLRFIDDPNVVVERLRTITKADEPEIKLRRDAHGKPIFNRSLAYQATRLYPEKQQMPMRRLIQTTFAAPFVWRERAVGQYGESLGELVWVQPDQHEYDRHFQQIKQPDQVFCVHECIDVPLLLPSHRSRFGDAIKAVRDSEDGVKLRAAVRSLGTEYNFRRQSDAWYAVAAALAEEIVSPKKSSPKELTIRHTLMSLGQDAFLGASAAGVVGLGKQLICNQPDVTALGPIILNTMPEVFVGFALGLLFRPGIKVMQASLQLPEICMQLEKAVTFRCTPIELPPVVTASGNVAG